MESLKMAEVGSIVEKDGRKAKVVCRILSEFLKEGGRVHKMLEVTLHDLEMDDFIHLVVEDTWSEI